MIESQHQAESSAQRSAHQSLPRCRPNGRELRDVQRMRARAWPGADQNIHAKIFKRGVQHFLHVRQQAVNLIDKEHLSRADIAQDAGKVQLLLQNGPGGLLEIYFQLLSDDRGQRGLAQARRAVKQYVVHGLAAFPRRIDGDRQVFFEFCLTGEIGKFARAQSGFKLSLIRERRGGNNPAVSHVFLAYLKLADPAAGIQGCIDKPGGLSYAKKDDRSGNHHRNVEILCERAMGGVAWLAIVSDHQSGYRPADRARSLRYER